MATIVEDIKRRPIGAQALNGSGYLRDIDHFFDEHSSRGAAKPGGLLSENLGQRIFAIDSYIGEVARRELGGEWIGNDDDPQAEINVELKFADGMRCWPAQRAMKRLKNGAENGIAARGSGAGLDVGPTPKRATRTLQATLRMTPSEMLPVKSDFD